MRGLFIVWFILSVAYVARRGNARFTFGRQLSDHSTFLAPINCLCYLFSPLRVKAYIDENHFPELAPLKANWEVIREEALAVDAAQKISASTHYNDIGFNSFLRPVGVASI